MWTCPPHAKGCSIERPFRVNGRSPHGFTLVELVTTIMLISILGAIAGPKFFTPAPFSARGYADEVASALRLAQKIAVGSGCNVRVTINNNGYTAAHQAQTSGVCSGNVYNVPALRIDGSTLSGTRPKDAVLSRSLSVTFDGAGKLTTTASQSFQIGSFTISVDPMTGLVNVT